MKTCGIYCIEVIGGNPDKLGFKYIGQSEDCKRREYKHFHLLNKKTHVNKKLQSYFDKYGRNSLKFIVLMECDRKELDFWEKLFVKIFDSKNSGFNFRDGGNSFETRSKKCIMQNIVTKEIVEYESLTAFGKAHNVSSSITGEVLDGKRKHVKEWFKPGNGWNPKLATLISPSGEEVLVYNVSEFCRKRNIPNPSAMTTMISGKTISYYGWRADVNRKSKLFRSFKLKNKNGEIIETENVSKFARENNLSLGSIYSLFNGEIKIHRGWTTVE